MTQPSRAIRKIPVLAILATAVCLSAAACSGSSSSLSSAKMTTGTSAGPSYSFGRGLGFYDGKSGPSGIEAAASWLGSSNSVKYAQDFIDATDWSHISTPWQLSNWKDSPFTMIWGVPMLPCGGPSTQCPTNVAEYNQVAGGGADGYYKTLAENLVAAGFGTSYIRLGWEFNASWMGWSVCNGQGSGLDSWASDFVPAFRNIVTSMRSVSGANFKFIWNPLVSSNASCIGGNLEKFYPGDKYVDMVALDVYDGVGQAVSSNAARWTDLVNGVNGGNWTSIVPESVGGQSFKGYGLSWLAAFGRKHGKEIGIPEWGLNMASAMAGGGDDPYFVTQMAAWIKANASGPAIFWNYNDGTLPLDIPNDSSGQTPAATAAFKVAFGAGS
jgi:Glycosyl hydrolase family 26